MTAQLRPKVTVFRDLTGARAQLVDFDIETMVLHPQTYKRKQDMPLLRHAEYGTDRTPKGSLRHDRNLKKATGLELDYDSERLAYATAAELLKASGLQCSIYTSPSHTPDKPRWRVLIPFESPVTEDIAIQRLGCVGLFEDVLGVSFNSDTTKISQSYYYGRLEGSDYQAEVIEGIPVDRHPDLPFFIETAKALQGEALDQEQKMRDLATGENITESAMSLIGKQVQAGMSREYIITAMTAMIEAAEGRSPAEVKQRVRDLPRQVDNIIALHHRNHGEDRGPDPGTKEGLHFQRWGEIVDFKMETQLVEDVFTVNASSLVIAGYNVGKSALLLDMCVKIAAGETWAGKRVIQRPCLYLAAEGAGSIYNRIQAYKGEYPDLPIHVLPGGGWSLADGRSRAHVENAVVEYCQQEGIEEAGLVVIDTLTEAAPGIDENSTVLGDIISWSKHLATRVKGHVSTAHHVAKHSGGSRGHTSAPAAADTIIQLLDKDGVITATVTKQRDLSSRGEAVQFRILGFDTGLVSNFGTPALVARVEYLSDFQVIEIDGEPPTSPAAKLEQDVLSLLSQGPFTGTWTALVQDAWQDGGPKPSKPTCIMVRKLMNESGVMKERGKGHSVTFEQIPVDLDNL